MKAISIALLLKLVPLATAASEPSPGLEKRVSYDGFSAVRIKTHNNASAIAEKLRSLSVVPLNVDTTENMDVAIPAEDAEDFARLDLETETIFEDFGAEIASEGSLVSYDGASTVAALPDETWWDAYHSYDDHVQMFQDMQAAFPSNSEMVSAGTSYEGRDLYGIHLWGSGGKDSKPAVYFHGTVHAREWITTMVVEYLTYKLIQEYGSDADTTSMLDSYDFYIFPIVNPDGFLYTQTNDRLWRKNRQPRSGSSCVGTDENRNWPHAEWSAPGGASTNPCDQTYRGEAAGDTPEMQGLVAFTQQLAQNNGIKLFIDWHSYGQYILLPYGYDCDKQAENHDIQMALAENTADLIQDQFGTVFTYGQSCPLLYATTGDSTDYMMDNAGSEFAWTFELRPRSSWGGGFVLPASQIMAASEEQWAAMKYLINEI